MKIINIYLMWGLPGSGKTYQAKIIAKSLKDAKIIDLDSDYETFETKLKRLRSRYSVFIFDGLITTNEQVIKLLDRIETVLKPSTNFLYYYIIFFPENREFCLKNDIHRNKVEGRPLSNITINKLKLEEPQLKLLGDRKIVMIKKDVVNPGYVSFKEKYGLEDSFNGTHWIVSSDNRSCYTYIEEPNYFDELDNLLLKICPNISFLHYKQIVKECVRLKEEYDGDYYSTYTYHNHECNVEKLYNALDRLGLVK